MLLRACVPRPQPEGCRITGTTISIMATVIPLSAIKADRPATQRRSAHGAQIVIFPGVRYERIVDAEPATQTVACDTRDRLSIPD